VPDARRLVTRFRLIGVVAAAAVALGAGVAFLAIRDDDAPAPSGVRPRGRYTRANAGLCQARAAARSGDLTGSRSAFFNRAHLSLHQLAVEATSRDRPAAARLLKAKEAVEMGLRTPGPSLGSDLDRLLAAMGDATTAVGEAPPPPCPEGGRP
jgi:hypothetical protein